MINTLGESELDFPNLPIAVMGDRERFMQVLVRLTKNALKYSAQKSVTVKVAYDVEAQLLCAQIKDEGKGLSPEQIERVRAVLNCPGEQKMSHLSPGESAANPTLYQGLRTCNELAKVNGGSLSFHSDGLNRGTTFQFQMLMPLTASQRVSAQLGQANDLFLTMVDQ